LRVASLWGERYDTTHALWMARTAALTLVHFQGDQAWLGSDAPPLYVKPKVISIARPESVSAFSAASALPRLSLFAAREDCSSCTD